MSEQGFKIMEKDILASENLPQPEEKTQDLKNKKGFKLKPPKAANIIGKIKTLILFFKTPKKIIILMLIATATLTIFAFVSLSAQKEESRPLEQTEPLIETPSPALDAEIEDYKKQVENYNQEFDKLEISVDDLSFPGIDLADVKF